MEYLMLWFVFAILAAAVASSKGRSGFGWFILGLPLGLFALLAVGFMPSLKKDPFAPTPDTHVRCPDCREFVFRDAVKCKHCGVALVPQAVPPSSAELLGRKVGGMFASKKNG